MRFEWHRLKGPQMAAANVVLAKFECAGAQTNPPGRLPGKTETEKLVVCPCISRNDRLDLRQGRQNGTLLIHSTRRSKKDSHPNHAACWVSELKKRLSRGTEFRSSHHEVCPSIERSQFRRCDACGKRPCRRFRLSGWGAEAPITRGRCHGCIWVIDLRNVFIE